MGKLVYGDGFEINLDDRVLSHLQIVMGLKLRRKEGFFFSWSETVANGSGRVSVWIDPSVPLVFRYRGGRLPSVNREWLTVLTASSNSSAGLQLTPEIEAETAVPESAPRRTSEPRG